MKIETSRLEYNELSCDDIETIKNIAHDIAFNDTINLLLDYDKDTLEKFLDKKNLVAYQDIIKHKAAELELSGINKEQIYKHIPSDTIPQDLWHINFSMLKPDFNVSAHALVTQARIKQKQEPREGYWFSIKDKESRKIIGCTMLSTKILLKNGIPCIGHSGQFIHPDFQKKGLISETKAVMVDFMYKYLIDSKGKSIPDNTMFFTTCDILNKGSQKLQKKSGAMCVNPTQPIDNKLYFIASRKDMIHSDLLSKRDISWYATFDNGCSFHSSTNPNFNNENDKKIDIDKFYKTFRMKNGNE